MPDNREMLNDFNRSDVFVSFSLSQIQHGEAVK